MKSMYYKCIYKSENIRKMWAFYTEQKSDSETMKTISTTSWASQRGLNKNH